MCFNMVLDRRVKSTFLQSKQGESIPDLIRTTCFSLYSCFDKGCPTTAQKAHATITIGITVGNSFAVLR